MKWFRTLAVIAATVGATTSAQAGLFSFGGKCGAEKSSGCAPTCQPRCCKPKIQRPCESKVHTYQRAISKLVKPCCKPKDCAPAKVSCCAPAAKKCAPACGPKAKGCAAPNAGACAPACGPKKAECAAPNGSKCAPACAPKAADCAAPNGSKCAPACGPKGKTCAAPCDSKCAPACGPKGKTCAAPCDSKCAPAACAPKGKDCAAPAACGPKSDACGPKSKACCGDDRECCDDDPCEIAELIYESQTACYAKHRARAVDRLGDRYNCRCNPEIMCALVYALNDCDERVRHEAADEIGDQVRKNGCCCMNDKVVAALTQALADCDRGVRKEAEEALEACGYEVVDCCDDKCGAGCAPRGKCGPAGCKPAGPACDPNCHAPEAAPKAPAEGGEGDAAPAPAPPEEKAARRPLRSRLSRLFSLLD